jgi:hypothetical protein
MNSIEEQELLLLTQKTYIFNVTKMRAKFSAKNQTHLRSSIGYFMGYIQRYSRLVIDFRRNRNNTDKKYLFRDSLKLENKIILGIFLIMEVIFGLLGLGVPNLYFFVAFLYRCSNNNAMLYGLEPYDGQTYYLVNYAIVVYCAEDRIMKNAEYNMLLENFNRLELNNNILNEIDKSAFNGIIDVLFVIKLFQCIPFVGAIGGFMCWNEFRKMVKFQSLKFQRIRLNSPKR